MDDCSLDLICLLNHVAERCVVKADELTIGGHPDGALRDDGQLAVLDWDQNGGPIVASGDDAAVLVIHRVGQIRTLGAIMLAVENDEPEDCGLLHDIVTGARALEENTAGGPTDPLLRLGLAARAVALDAMGMPGEWADRVAKARGTGVLGLDGYDFRDYERIGMLPLTTPDRAAMQERAAAA